MRDQILFGKEKVSRVLMEQEFNFYYGLLKNEKAMQGLHDHGLVAVTTEPGFGPDCPYIAHPMLPPQGAKNWTFSQFKDAALFFLDFWDYLVENDFSLQDSHSGNIMFHHATPYFVDFCSIGPGEAATVSPAFINDFFRCWIGPLAALKLGELVLFRQVVEKRMMWDEAKCLYPSAMQLEVAELRDLVVEKFSRYDLKGFLSVVREWIDSVIVQHKVDGCDSEHYQHGEVLSPTIDTMKDEILLSVIDKFNPGSYLDMGCNKGKHSCLAASKGLEVVSLDLADSLLDKLYLTAKINQLPIDPFFVDTSKIDLFNVPFRKFDMVSCFALMHHLVFSSGMRVEDLCEKLSKICRKVLILEFIEPVKIETFVHAHYSSEKHGSYSLSVVEKLLGELFDHVEKVETSPTRIVLIANRE